MSHIMHNLVIANLLRPRFSGVCWSRDQPMPGSFPTPFLYNYFGIKKRVGGGGGVGDLYTLIFLLILLLYSFRRRVYSLINSSLCRVPSCPYFRTAKERVHLAYKHPELLLDLMKKGIISTSLACNDLEVHLIMT